FQGQTKDNFKCVGIKEISTLLCFISLTHFSVLKNIAQPSTCFLSCSDMILARDFGEKNPSYPRSFNAGRKRV
ncbi:hypothetical protein DBR06_SOUSAS19810018, partial [Sousa chinensis]